MNKSTNFLNITPVLPSSDIARDVTWYKEKTGFHPLHSDNMYAVLHRDGLYIHLQWHADTKDDPLLGGSVIRIFVESVFPLFQEYVKRGTVPQEKLQFDTPWETHEFGFYDLNKNAIFLVEDID